MNYYNKRIINRLIKRFCSSKTSRIKEENENSPVDLTLNRAHKYQLNKFIQNNPQIEKIKHKIPKEYLNLKRLKPPEIVYLIDNIIAKDIVQKTLPEIQQNKQQLICENNAGLGLITTELLNNGIDKVKVYESCQEFQTNLEDLNNKYPGRMELISEDFFLMSRHSFCDKRFNSKKVEKLLENCPKKNWSDSPFMTIFGTLYQRRFISYLIRSLAFQRDIVNYGRIHLYLFLRPADYVVLTAGPHLNLHTYQTSSILFNLFFDWKFIEKYPRKAFLPWEQIRLRRPRYCKQVDSDQMYFVSIEFKKELPLATEYLLQFYYFVNQFYRRGTTRIIPTLEKSLPGSGLNIIIPQLNHENYFKNMNIFTTFGELTPQQLLYVFKELINHPGFNESTFLPALESRLINDETIETYLDEELEKNSIKTNNLKLNDK